MFDKIATLIEERHIHARDCIYHTSRELERGGRIRVLVLKGENMAHVEYICPGCGHYEYRIQPWKRPFSARCAGCSRAIRVSKLKRS